MSSGLNPGDLERLKAFIATCQKNPQIMWLPELKFFRDYIESLGGSLPKPQAEETFTSESSNNAQPQPDNSKSEDSPTPMEDVESEESEVELDNDGVIEPETIDPPEMGDQSKEVSEDDEISASEKRSEAQGALGEGDLDKAIELFTEAIKLNPHSAMLYAKRANVLLKQKRVKAALRDCDEALNLNPDSATAHKYRGRAERMMNRRRVIVKWEHSYMTEEVDIKYLVDSNGCAIQLPRVGLNVMMWSSRGCHLGVIVKTYFNYENADTDSQNFTSTSYVGPQNSLQQITSVPNSHIHSETSSSSLPSQHIHLQSNHMMAVNHHQINVNPCQGDIDNLLRKNEHGVSQINLHTNNTCGSTTAERFCSCVNCSEVAFATCIAIGCDNLICFAHFSSNPLCPNHVHTIYQDPSPNATVLQPGGSLPQNLCINVTDSLPTHRKCKSKKAKIKILRNKGLEYQSEKSGKIISSKRKLRARCISTKCSKTLYCNSFSDVERFNILNSYYNLEKLEAQRQFILRHIDISTPKNKPVNFEGRKKRSIGYFLPKSNGQKKEVCRIMFLSTLNIAERQVRTVIEKITNTGTLEPEKRGGRKQAQKEKDLRLKKSVEDHLNRFPGMENHYCSSSNSHRCLPGDLSVKKMYNMYKDSMSMADDLASYSFYYRIFKIMKFKFHT